MSLNASIEAARAGDAGKGFAVVAQEIRVLSDNTNTELENIKQIISSLVEECRYCVQASGTIVEDNAKQKEEIKAVLDEFGSLDEQIQKTAEKADEIEELVTAMIELNDDITKSSKCRSNRRDECQHRGAQCDDARSFRNGRTHE